MNLITLNEPGIDPSNGSGYMHVWLSRTNDCVFVFGIADDCVYVEGFEAQSGTCNFRFCSHF